MLEYGRGVHFNVDELMPCPCCGSESEIFATYFLWGSARAMNFGYSARCTNPECGVRIKLFRYLWEAIAVWNNRTGRHEEPRITPAYAGKSIA